MLKQDIYFDPLLISNNNQQNSEKHAKVKQILLITSLLFVMEKSFRCR